MGITQEHAVARAHADTCSFFKNLYFRLRSGQLTRSAFDGATGDMAAQYAMEGVSDVQAGQDAHAVRTVAETFVGMVLRPEGRPYDPADYLAGLVELEPAARLKFIGELVIEYGGEVPDETGTPDA